MIFVWGTGDTRREWEQAARVWEHSNCTKWFWKQITRSSATRQAACHVSCVWVRLSNTSCVHWGSTFWYKLHESSWSWTSCRTISGQSGVRHSNTCVQWGDLSTLKLVVFFSMNFLKQCSNECSCIESNSESFVIYVQNWNHSLIRKHYK